MSGIGRSPRLEPQVSLHAALTAKPCCMADLYSCITPPPAAHSATAAGSSAWLAVGMAGIGGACGSGNAAKQGSHRIVHTIDARLWRVLKVRMGQSTACLYEDHQA